MPFLDLDAPDLETSSRVRSGDLTSRTPKAVDLSHTLKDVEPVANLTSRSNGGGAKSERKSNEAPQMLLVIGKEGESFLTSRTSKSHKNDHEGAKSNRSQVKLSARNDESAGNVTSRSQAKYKISDEPRVQNEILKDNDRQQAVCVHAEIDGRLTSRSHASQK